MATDADRLSPTADAGDNPFPLINAGELGRGRSSPDWLIEGCLVRRQLGEIAGPKKSLKTSISIDMAVAVAGGAPFLGRYLVPKIGKVVVMSFETDGLTLKQTMRAVCGARGLDFDDVQSRIMFLDRDAPMARMPRADRPEDRERLASLIEQYQPDLVILDPGYKVIPESSGLLSVQAALIAEFADVFSKGGATLVIVHHSRKEDRNSVRKRGSHFLDLDEISGAGHAEATRQFLLVRRYLDYRPGKAHSLAITIGGSANFGDRCYVEIDNGTHERFKWDVQFIDQPRQAEKQEKQPAVDVSSSGKPGPIEEKADAAITAMKSAGCKLTKTELRKLIGCSGEVILKVIDHLKATGQIVVTKNGRIEQVELAAVKDGALELNTDNTLDPSGQRTTDSFSCPSAPVA